MTSNIYISKHKQQYFFILSNSFQQYVLKSAKMEAHVLLQIAAPALVDGLGALAVKVCGNDYVVYEDATFIFIPVSINHAIN